MGVSRARGRATFRVGVGVGIGRLRMDFKQIQSLGYCYVG